MTRACLAAVCLVLALQATAWGQAAMQSTQSTDVTRTAGSAQPAGRFAKFTGSSVQLATYVGTGSFYVSGYRNPFASLALFAIPAYDLGTKYKLAIRGRIILEQELTTPDTPNGRRFYPYDPWFWLAADNLRTFERTKIKLGGIVRTILPVSYESRYNNLLFGAAIGMSVSREFEFGQVNDEARKWTLRLSWAPMFTKYFYTSPFRGDGPGDTTGCLAPSSAAGTVGTAGPTSSEADRCGGPLNTNYAVANSFLAGLIRGKVSLMVSLYIANAVKFGFPEDAFTADNAVPVGRTDTTWGIIAATYKYRPHMGLSVGISSLQPALDSRYRYPRFPFFDLSGGANANNFTQFFMSVNGSI
jgi:hypothetical protein